MAGRHARIRCRHTPRPRWPPLQGELRHGVEPGGQAPHAGRPRRSNVPARSCSRRASARRGCTSIRSVRASRTSSTRSSPVSARRARTLGPTRSQSSRNERWSVCRAPPDTTRAVRSGCRGDRQYELRPDGDRHRRPCGRRQEHGGSSSCRSARAGVPRHGSDVPGGDVRGAPTGYRSVRGRRRRGDWRTRSR